HASRVTCECAREDAALRRHAAANDRASERAPLVAGGGAVSAAIEHVVLVLDYLLKEVSVREIAFFESLALFVRHLAADVATDGAFGLFTFGDHLRSVSAMHFSSFSRNRLIRTRNAPGVNPNVGASSRRLSVS